MAGKERKKGYLTYDDNPITRGKLLKDRKRTCFNIIIGDKTYFTKYELDKQLKEHLQTKLNAKILPVEIIEESGTEYLFNIPGTKSRTLKIEGITKIRVRIVADDVETLVSKMGQIKAEMRKCGENEKECIWEKEGELEINLTEKQKTIPEYSYEATKAMKMLELQTFRQN